MKCPKLSELPAPPAGRTGWPWTEESTRLPDAIAARDSLPVISVITPSYNQGNFLEETIRSVLLQGYPKLNYIIMDGGSSDESVEIIKKYSQWLSYWVSEPDAGQSDAINRGLMRATGQFATWINSDDLVCKNALTEHGSKVGFNGNSVYVGYCVYIDEYSEPVSMHRGRVQTLEDLVRVKDVWRCPQNQGHIDQPAVLFPRDLALSVGGLSSDNHLTMDYELWGKLLRADATIQYTDVPFGMFRTHQGQKIHDMVGVTESLLSGAAKLVQEEESFPEDLKRQLHADLDAYRIKYNEDYWLGSGRLATLGLPPVIVNPIRKLRAMLKKRCTN